MSRFHTTEFDFLPEKAFRPRAGKFGPMTLEGNGKGGSTPAPDPAIGRYYDKMGDISGEMWEEARGLLPMQRQQLEQSIKQADESSQNAREDRTYQLGRRQLMDDRYDNVQVPLEDQLIGTAKSWNEPVEQERMAREAGEDVAGSFQQANGQTMRAMAARGLNPNSGAAMSAMNDNGLVQAMAGSSAINRTREAARQIGWSRLGEATALGKGLTGFGMASQAAAASANGQGFQMGTAGNGLVGQAAEGINATGSGANKGFGAAAGGLGSIYNTQVQANTAANDSAAGTTGAIVGGIATVGAAFL